MLHCMLAKEDWRCFKKGDDFDFHPGVNLIVGDQGTGKSSMIQAIRAVGSKKDDHQGVGKKWAYFAELCRIASYDFEKDNFRTLSYFAGGDATMFQVASMFKSHGEMVLTMLEGLIKFDRQGSHMLFVLDEPDMALSVRSIRRLAKIFKELADKGDQIIAAVHNPFLIWSQQDVYSIEHRKWMTSKEFIKTQTEETKGAMENPVKPVPTE
ncbi:MAG: hypothetical protein AMXMBFR16_11240 [Candidatus Uhrbacteria bacterium]